MKEQHVEVIFCGQHQKTVKLILMDGTEIGRFALHGYAGRFEDDKLALGICKLYELYLKPYVS